MMKIAFGGMSAEELFFGESGTGPSGDLVHATTIAAQMVGSFGMAGSLVSYEAIEAGPISQGIVGKVLGNEDARAAVEKLLAQAKADVQMLLDDNRHLVIALRDELLDEVGARRRRDRRRAARGRSAQTLRRRTPARARAAQRAGAAPRKPDGGVRSRAASLDRGGRTRRDRKQANDASAQERGEGRGQRRPASRAGAS